MYLYLFSLMDSLGYSGPGVGKLGLKSNSEAWDDGLILRHFKKRFRASFRAIFIVSL